VATTSIPRVGRVGLTLSPRVERALLVAEGVVAEGAWAEDQRQLKPSAGLVVCPVPSLLDLPELRNVDAAVEQLPIVMSLATYTCCISLAPPTH
jgi:hypothetical protein